MKFYERLVIEPKSVTTDQAKQYRQSDSHLDDPAHTDLGNALTRLCRQLNRPLTVLDLGCGCGRHFRFLEGAQKIVGIDVSSEMLKEAEHPAGEDKIKASLELICGNFFSMEFPEHSFDLIYSCGVFGLWMPLDEFILKKISRWLKPDGRALLVVVDAKSPSTTTWKGKVAHAARNFMPAPIKRVIDSRPGSQFLKLYESELRQLMTNTEFNYTIWHRGNPARRVDLVCEVQRGNG